MLVSVIIPCFNVEKYISECIQSVLKQEYKDLQIICVDNGSTDRTLELLTRMAQEHSSLITLLQEPKKGAPYARNKGIEVATGEYINFLDADDLLYPAKIDTQVKLAIKENFPDIIAGNYSRQLLNGEQESFNSMTTDQWLALFYRKMGCTCSNLFRTNSVKAVGGFDTELKSSQEYDLMFRILKGKGRVIFDTRDYTLVRDRAEGSISFDNKKENMARYLDLRVAIYRHLVKSTSDTQTLKPYSQALFDCLRMNFTYNPEQSVKFYHSELPSGFKPVPSVATGRFYLILYRIFGFTLAEKIRNFLPF